MLLPEDNLYSGPCNDLTSAGPHPDTVTTVSCPGLLRVESEKRVKRRSRRSVSPCGGLLPVTTHLTEPMTNSDPAKTGLAASVPCQTCSPHV